ncbi:MAG: hypothetical protein PHZ09_08260, partial [Eubacteriales bacterium]|nr:hypothetical protein [Eubacteriales bacterium]
MRFCKSYLIILFTAALTACLFGCEKQSDEIETIILESVFEKQLFVIDERFLTSDSFDIGDGKIYVPGRVNDPDSPVSKPTVAIINIETQEAEYIETEITESALGFCMTPTGYAVFVGRLDNLTSKMVYSLRLLSREGHAEASIILPVNLYEDERVYLRSDDESVYLACFDKLVRIDTNTKSYDVVCEFAELGELVCMTANEQEPRLLISNKFGENLLFTFTDGTIEKINTQNEEYIKTAENIFMPDGGSTLLFMNKHGIYAAEPGMKQLINFTNSCIDRDHIIDMKLYGGKFYMMYRDMPSGALSLYMLSEAADSGSKSRIVVRVSYYESGAGTIPAAANKFNTVSEKYFAICDEKATVFSETAEESARMLSDFDKMIFGGRVSDVVVFSGDFQKYADKGVFLDLYELIENDPVLSGEEFFPCVLDSLVYNSGLYVITPGFRLKTFIGIEENFPNSIWDVAAFMRFVSSLKEGKLLPVMNRDNLAEILLYSGVLSYIDINSGSFELDRNVLSDIFGYLSDLPEKTTLPEDFNDYNPYREGRYLLYNATICNIADYLSLKVRFGIDNVPVILGYPSKDGGRAIVQSYDLYAISKKSRVSEGAWEFVKFLLNGTDINSYIPTLKNRFNAWSETQKNYTYLFMNGSAIYTALPEHMAVNFPGKKIDLTDEIVAEFQNAVFSVKASAQVPDEIKTIITEDVTDLFNGV